MKRTLVIALIVVCMMFGVVAYATAVTTGTVTATVTPNPKLSLAINTPTVAFGAQDPGYTGTINNTAILTVSSNNRWDLAKTVTGATINLTTSMGPLTSQARSSAASVDDNYTITNLPWSLDGGTLQSGSVLYTVTKSLNQLP